MRCERFDTQDDSCDEDAVEWHALIDTMTNQIGPWSKFLCADRARRSIAHDRAFPIKGIYHKLLQNKMGTEDAIEVECFIYSFCDFIRSFH